MKKYYLEIVWHKILIFILFAILFFQITWYLFQEKTALNNFSVVVSCFCYSYLINAFLEKYKPKKVWQLRSLIEKQVKKYGSNCDLNHINVSKMTNMSGLFFEIDFNGDISKWDVSNVKDMSTMFHRSNFNGDISGWNISSVEKMEFMFANSTFNGDISKWDVSNVKKMDFMFHESKYEGNLNEWNVINLESMQYMFDSSKFKNIVFYNLGIEDEDNNLLDLPYWANYEDAINRKNAVINYHLNKYLIVNLEEKDNDVKTKKIKI